MKKLLKKLLIFILCAGFFPLAAATCAANPPKVSPEVSPKVPSEVPQSDETDQTTFLELFWFIDDAPREALLMVPKTKVPMLFVRILTPDEKLTVIIGEQVSLSTDKDALVLECSAPKVLFGTLDAKKYVPEIFILESDGRAALEQNGKKSPCVLNPVTPENFSEIIKKYTIPEEPES